MNTTDKELERQLRGLRPGRLPEDLGERIGWSIEGGGGRRLRRRGVGIVATGLAAAVGLGLWVGIERGMDGVRDGAEDTVAVSLWQKKTTLLDSKPLRIYERDGGMWEVREQQWLEEEIAFDSATPSGVRLSAARTEVVSVPVKFD